MSNIFTVRATPFSLGSSSAGAALASIISAHNSRGRPLAATAHDVWRCDRARMQSPSFQRRAAVGGMGGQLEVSSVQRPAAIILACSSQEGGLRVMRVHTSEEPNSGNST